MNDYRDVFRLHGTPFTPELPIEQRLDLDFLDDALGGLRTAVERRMSAAITGAAGTGKTLLLRALCHELPEVRYQVRYVKVTDVSKRDMCREICAVLGVEPAGTYPTLVRRLQDRLLAEMNTDGLRPVLLLDEAHGMRPEVLGMLRVLTNFEMDSKLVVSIVLAGQPQLAELLRRDELSDVARRISFYAKLRLLTKEEVQRYVGHRLAIVGAAHEIIAPEAIDTLYELGRGNPRAIDYLALTSLEMAAKHGKTVVEYSHVVEAAARVSP